jgi:hypothetical protein
MGAAGWLQVCYSYGKMRDDYAVVHYGFLPQLEDPPRLLLVSPAYLLVAESCIPECL